MAFIRTKKHRLLDDNTYMLQSEWTSSHDVEMDDGKNIEESIKNTNTRVSTLETKVTTLENSVSLLTQDIKSIEVVSALPSSPSSTTLYVIVDS